MPRVEESRVETEQGAPLLATKVHVPSPRKALIRRPGLVEQLRGADSRLTLVDAPPGWGKTTLLAEWAAGEAVPFAWLSLDRRDDDPVRFWTYLVEALRSVEPGIGAATLATVGVPGADIREVVLPSLVNELAAGAAPLVLVLDDYHLVSSSEIHHGVAFLLEQLPARVRLVLATRADPPLPLARLRARGDLVEIRADDLRFSRLEAGTLLNDVLGLGLDDEDVGLLQDRTEGWAAGLHLAALSLRGRSDPREFIRAFAGDHRHVVDYLGAELLDGLPDGLRRFLLRTSILDRLCGPLCDAVTGDERSAERLEEIERANLLLVPLDAKREWYRYHHLFGELLRHELERSEPAEVPELHRRAAAWHFGAGSVEDAIHHSVATAARRAEAIGDAVELIADHWHGVFNQGRLATVSEWLDALPDTAVAGDARLAVARVWIALDHGRLDEAARWLAAAELVAPPSLAAETAVLRAVHRFKVGDTSEALAAARRAVALDPEETPLGRAVAFCVLGLTSFWRGRAGPAADALAEAARLMERVDNVLGRCYALGYLATVAVEGGELDRADALAREVEDLAREPGVGEHFAVMIGLIALGRTRTLRGDLDGAEEPLARAVELSRRGAGIVEGAYALVAGGELHAARGELPRAGALLAKAGALVASCPHPGLVAHMLNRAERELRAAAPAQDDRAGEPLSVRELAVLRLLQGTFTQREIGATLYVSLNTVKTHTRSIYRKLGASDRAEAVARARELGLL